MKRFAIVYLVPLAVFVLGIVLVFAIDMYVTHVFRLSVGASFLIGLVLGFPVGWVVAMLHLSLDDKYYGRW